MIVPKLSAASFAVGVVKPYMTRDSLKMIYYSYLYLIINCGLIFWENSSYSNSIFEV
jgi:hypothetical protein